MSDHIVPSASLVRRLGVWRTPGAGPAYRQLAGALRLLILDGRLSLSARLPGERELAHVLALSRTTVSGAYGLLREAGFLDGGQGEAARTRLPSETEAALPRPGAQGSGTGPGVIDMTSAVLPADASIHAAYVRALERLPACLPGHGYENEGLDALREAVAAAYDRRGLPTTPGQILITHGAHNGLVHLLRLMLRPGGSVVIDQPTYPQAIDAILAAGGRPRPVALHEEGEAAWDIEAVASTCRRSGAAIAYLVLDHNNPTGRMMSASDRHRLLAALGDAPTLLALDETLIELTLDGPPAARESIVDSPRIVRLGSMSKTVWGGLRIGWIRAERAIIQRLAQARASLDLGVPVLEQLAAVELLADDRARLMERCALLRSRRDHLLSRLAERLPDWICPSPPGGLSVWARLPAPISSALAVRAAAEGLRLAAGPRFGVNGAFENRLRLPYTLPAHNLDAAVDRLAAANRTLVGQTPARSRAGHTSTFVGLPPVETIF